MRRDEAEWWGSLRARLWPDADPGELAAEALEFIDGGRMPAIEAVFVAKDDEPAVGFIEIAVRPFADGCRSMPVPHVEGWYVEPSARGRGVGRALLEAAEQWARARGFSEIASDCEINNHGSIAAHGCCGFVETERLVKFRKDL